MTTRWYKHPVNADLEAPAVDEFMNEITEVCRRHGLVVGHEDHHGAFVVQALTEQRLTKLSEAHVAESAHLLANYGAMPEGFQTESEEETAELLLRSGEDDDRRWTVPAAFPVEIAIAGSLTITSESHPDDEDMWGSWQVIRVNQHPDDLERHRLSGPHDAIVHIRRR